MALSHQFLVIHIPDDALTLMAEQNLQLRMLKSGQTLNSGSFIYGLSMTIILDIGYKEIREIRVLQKIEKNTNYLSKVYLVSRFMTMTFLMTRHRP